MKMYTYFLYKLMFTKQIGFVPTVSQKQSFMSYSASIKKMSMSGNYTYIIIHSMANT